MGSEEEEAGVGARGHHSAAAGGVVEVDGSEVEAWAGWTTGLLSQLVPGTREAWCRTLMSMLLRYVNCS